MNECMCSKCETKFNKKRCSFDWVLSELFCPNCNEWVKAFP